MGGRQSMGRRMSSGKSRQSLGPRRSSMYNRSGKISDPRPLGDRKYTNKNTRTLVEYLTAHNYDKQITHKQVTAPSLKDFKNIVSFLFRQLDPNFEFSDSFEEDVRDVLKKLGYPFTISKSSLSAVGSPHTWPPILAMLCWVIELLTYLEILDEEEMKTLETDESKMFFEFLASAYKNFLEGDDNFEGLVDELKGAFDHRTQIMKDEIQRFQDQNDDLMKEVDALSQDSNTVSGLQSKRADYLSDLAKFEKLNLKLETHLESVLQKKETAEKELQELTEQMKERNCQQEDLKETLENQPLSQGEVKRMMQETQMKQDAIDNLHKQKEEITRDTWNTEMLQCKVIGQVEELADEYNNMVSELQLTPATSTNAGGIEYNVTLQPHADDIKEMVSQDLTHTIKPGLSKLDEKTKAMNRQLEAQLRDVKQELMRTTDMKSEADAKVEQSESRLTKIHEAYRSERTLMNKQSAESLNALEEIELAIHRTRTAQANDLRKSEQQVTEIEEQMKVSIKQQLHQETKAQDEITAMVEQLAQHREWVVQTLTDTSDKIITKREEVEKVCTEKW